MVVAEFHSDQVDATEDFLVKAYTKMQIGSSSKRFHARVARGMVGGISLDRLEIGFDMRYDANPLGKVCLCTVQTGRITDQTTDGWVDDFGPGDVVSFAPFDRPYSGTIRNSHYTITIFDPALLSKVAGTTDRRAEPVRILGHRTVDDAAAVRLRSTIDFLREQVAATPDQPLVGSTASMLLAATVLSAFETTAGDPRSGDRRDSHPGTVRRAVAFIESHPDGDIGPADIAAAAHVSVRAIQLAFRKHLGTTPMGYLRKVRLAQAHQELLAGGPGVSVSGVAARWGFFHPGRFAAEYQTAYGVSPSATLRGV
ncbi:helix-turn-helix transcriptional regulator [Kribbella sp. NPDC051770]|uniref:AraC family transcriptional regulator n=1 Tax=Kribbella sp. NPDC051770 TaxID=3155413 RepID=UPI003438FC5F